MTHTKIFKITDENREEELHQAAQMILAGELVAIPTETVYGLGANALCEQAVREIYIAKGRPSDNPLIIHIAHIEDMDKYAKDIPESAYRLAEKFWPGPLTVILPKKNIISDTVSGHLPSVAIRCPAQKTARRLIEICNVPIAAPSANISGKPSPTSAKHVIEDMNGKISGIIDDGECRVGVESTIVSFLTEIPKILRPGGITKDDIEKIIGKVDIDKSIYQGLKNNEKPLAPGMKYKHYAPKADLIIIRGNSNNVINYMKEKNSQENGFIIFEEDKGKISSKNIRCIGRQNDGDIQAHRLFDILRDFDKTDEIKRIYSVCPSDKGVGLAVYNRLIKAAGFCIIDV